MDEKREQILKEVRELEEILGFPMKDVSGMNTVTLHRYLERLGDALLTYNGDTW